MVTGKISLPEELKGFIESHRKLLNVWRHTDLKFTLDGRLVGDIAEAVAATAFGLKFPGQRTPGVDLLTEEQRTVQVKASGIGKGPAFTPGRGKADFLIFMLIDFSEGSAEIVYNGPEAPVRAELPEGFTGTKRVSLKIIKQLNSNQTSRLTRKI